MPKKTSKTQNAEVIPSEEVSQVDQQTMEQVKKSKKSKVSKSVENVSSEQVVDIQQSVVSSNDVDVVIEGVVSGDNTEVSLSDMSSAFLVKLQKLSNDIASLKNEFKSFEKRVSREVKTAQKVSSKRKRKAVNRAPSGFVKPTKISDELATFLGKDKGSEMARTEVTRDINKYIRTNNLQDKENGRKINPDSKLAALLKLKKTDELTYFNLQRYMSPHFAKVVKETTA